MGGVWERQIRTVRNVLSSLLTHAGALDTDTIRTLFCEVMAIVNSRPLSVDNLYDPLSLSPITPNHILTMKSNIVLPPPGRFESSDMYCRKRWRRVQHLADLFWVRWRKEYLLLMQSRQCWQNKRRNMQVGDIVLLKDDVVSRNQWSLARVLEVYPSKDGLVRKVKIVIGDSSLDHNGKRIRPASCLDRPVPKLVLLLEAE